MTEAGESGSALRITPSQTVGPFFAYALTPSGRYALADLVTNDLSAGAPPDACIRVEGQVFDGDGATVADAMIEIWQADDGGRYPGAEPGRGNAPFRGFGRSATDREGRFAFTTLKPGRVPGPGGVLQAPHINIGLFARGLLRQLFTRLYFDDESEANGRDPILALVPRDARDTLIAKRRGGAHYRLDLHLQGSSETVFFEA